MKLPHFLSSLRFFLWCSSRFLRWAILGILIPSSHFRLDKSLEFCTNLFFFNLILKDTSFCSNDDSCGTSLFFEYASKNCEILAGIRCCISELFFCHLGAFIPVFWWLGSIEMGHVHSGQMLFPVPGDAWLLVFLWELQLVDIVLFHDLEKWLVSTELYWS